MNRHRQKGIRVSKTSKARSDQLVPLAGPRLAHSDAFEGTRASSAGLGFGQGTPRLTRTALALVLALAGLLALTAAPALAARTYETQIKGTCPSPGACAPGEVIPFANPIGLTTDASKNLWVTDTGHGAIDKFDPAGSFEAQGSGPFSYGGEYLESDAFSQAAGEVFLSDSGKAGLWGIDLADATSSGVHLEPLGATECCYLRVAADNSGGATDGDLYVSNGSTVTRIDATGAAADFSAGPAAGTNVLSGSFSGKMALAVAPNGDFYVSSGATVFGFEPSGESSGVEITEAEGSPLGSVNAVAVDPTNENVVITTGTAIDEFEPSGEFLSGSTITEANGTALGGIQGLAVDSAGTLYAADSSNAVVDVFGPAPPPLPKFNLEVTKTGTGQGTVTSSPGGINCGATCAHEFTEGKTVTLTATPSLISEFTGWSGCDAIAAGKCEVTMSAAKAVSAEFTAIPQETLEVTKTGSGAGEVTGTAPAGFTAIECGSTCAAEYNQGTVITLTAIPDPHSRLAAWSGCDSELEGKCQVALGAAKAVNAEFEVIPKLPLTVETTGPGSGAVSSVPAGIDCGPTCSAFYDEGTTVLLTAFPAAGSSFVGWSGCEVETLGLCRVTIGADQTVSATFASTAPCPNEELRAENHSTRLPDCRAYELVTPPYKQGFPVSIQRISEDGMRLFGVSYGAFAGTQGPPQTAQFGVEYRMTRGSDGWHTEALAPYDPLYSGVSTWFTTSADLTESIWSIPTAPVGEDDLYLRDEPGSFTDIGPMTSPSLGPSVGPAPPGAGPSETSVFVNGASADLSHVVFSMSVDGGVRQVWPGDETESNRNTLYEYSGIGNSSPNLVGVEGGRGSTALLGSCGIELGGRHSRFNAISADGETIFFTPVGVDTEPCPRAQPAISKLYARIGDTQTVDISQPVPEECTTPGCQSAPQAGSLFAGASRDGSKVFFVSTQQLVDSAVEDPNESDRAIERNGERGCSAAVASGCNLYEYDFAEPPNSRLVLASPGSAIPHVQGVVRISQDGSHVYFVAQGALTGTPNATGQRAEQGQENLYVFERDARFPEGKVSFIGRLSTEDEDLWGGSSNNDIGRPAQTTPDGRYFVFQSHADLTPDDSSHGVWQLFEYDAATELLVRVSKGQQGFNNDGNTTVADARIPAAFYGAQQGGQAPEPLALSSDGSYVWFESADSLTPGALDNVEIDARGDLANNVYEYHDGNISLLSSGNDVSVAGDNTGSSVRLWGGSATGDDVFFRTADRISSADLDGQTDTYDVRINGGTAPPARPSECQDETSCLRPASTVPKFPYVGTETQQQSASHTDNAGRRRSARKLAEAIRRCKTKRTKAEQAHCVRRAKARHRRESRALGQDSRRHLGGTR